MNKHTVLCDACGRNLTSATGTTFSAIIVTAEVSSEASPADENLLEQELCPYEVNKKYYICFACLLKSLGVKPKNYELQS